MKNDPDTQLLQEKIWRAALTALSIATLCTVLGALAWLLVQVAVFFKPILLPVCIAAVVAYLCEPAIHFLEHKKISRPWGVALLFVAGGALLLTFLGLAVPRAIEEASALSRTAPVLWERASQMVTDYYLRIGVSMKTHPEWLGRAQEFAGANGPKMLSALGGWVLRGVQSLPAWLSLVFGLALVPLYVFYMLVERHSIEANWKNYIPLRKEWFREEITHLIEEINRYLIVFFRGQVFVSACIGALTAVGLWAIGMDFALLLGVLTGVLSIVPYLGIALSLLPTLLMAYLQTQGWELPAMALGVFGLTQMIEGFFITPKIMGERVGLHPLTIVLAILVWGQILGGLLGAVLAIPLTATLKVLFFRYILPHPQAAETNG